MWDFHHPTPPLEQSAPPLNRGSTPSFGVLVIFYCLRGGLPPFLLEFFVRYLRIYQSIGTTKFRAWLWYHVRGLTPFLLEFFVRYLRIYQSIGTTKFRTWLWYHVRRTRLSTMVWYCPLWAHGFALGFPKMPHFSFINPWSFPKLADVRLSWLLSSFNKNQKKKKVWSI